MLERKEREIVNPPVRPQIVDEASEPGNLSVCIRPDLNVSERSLEWRTSQLRLRHEFVYGGGELYIQRSVIFRKHVLAIGLFAHFDPGDGVVPLVEICDFIGRILRR